MHFALASAKIDKKDETQKGFRLVFLGISYANNFFLCRMDFIQDQRFEKISEIALAEYEGCTFLSCDFSGAQLNHLIFTDCVFEDCNLSLAKLQQAALRDVTFRECKLLGLHFDACKPFNLSFRFEHCLLNHSSFYQVSIQQTVFEQCTLQEVDFTETDLSACIFSNCDLRGAAFHRTKLEKTDFRTAYNYQLDPEENRVKGAKFSKEGVVGLLGKYRIVVS